MRVGRPWGGDGATGWNFASGQGRVPSYAPPFARLTRGLPAGGYQWSLKPAVMLLLLVAWPKSVTAVVT
jgi:hypothetical protein